MLITVKLRSHTATRKQVRCIKPQGAEQGSDYV